MSPRARTHGLLYFMAPENNKRAQNGHIVCLRQTPTTMNNSNDSPHITTKPLRRNHTRHYRFGDKVKLIVHGKYGRCDRGQNKTVRSRIVTITVRNSHVLSKNKTVDVSGLSVYLWRQQCRQPMVVSVKRVKP